MSTSEAVRAQRLYGLDGTRSRDVVSSGNKAANLAIAAVAGLPVVPGFVLGAGVDLTSELASDDLFERWRVLSHDGNVPLIVRSSSPVEDSASSSMAGRFVSVADVTSWDGFVDAVEQVLASAVIDGVAHPMAVLVQQQLRSKLGGVLFGADPVTGSRDVIHVAASTSGAHTVVSGKAGSELTLDRRGRVKTGTNVLTHAQGRQLAKLSSAADRLFGAPQDVEWAFDDEGRLWLLQARPITTAAAAADAHSPVYGPGPLSETFPDPLSTLEQDLWIPPLREALAFALRTVGVKHRIDPTAAVIVVDGRPAIDLDLIGMNPAPTNFLARLDPRPPARRLVASWRVGRLRAALPLLADDVIELVDQQLEQVPRLDKLGEAELLQILEHSSAVLRSLHGYEILVGLVDPKDSGSTATAEALRVLQQRAGATYDHLVSDEPVLLSLVPPRIGAARTPSTSGGKADVTDEQDLSRREELRLRVRWVQELTARAAWELAGRLESSGICPSDLVRHCTASELASLVLDRRRPQQAPVAVPFSDSAPLPTAFRLTADGHVVPVQSSTKSRGQGASPGRARGVVCQLPAEPVPVGAILVVRTLDPNLATQLPGLSAIVAETGTALSHLAILAREMGIPAVVGFSGATERFPAGATITVDGRTGEVIEEPER